MYIDLKGGCQGINGKDPPIEEPVIKQCLLLLPRASTIMMYLYKNYRWSVRNMQVLR